MEFTIRNMMEQDKQEVLDMMRVFYASPQCRVMDRMRFLRMISEHA